jgi:hypothetical protein
LASWRLIPSPCPIKCSNAICPSKKIVSGGWP